MNTTAHEIELEPFAQTGPGEKSVLTTAFPYLESVKVTISVRVGASECSVAELLAMKQGDVVALDRLVEEPLDVLIDGHVVARGSLVAVGEHFGVRITETATIDPALARRA